MRLDGRRWDSTVRYRPMQHYIALYRTIPYYPVPYRRSSTISYIARSRTIHRYIPTIPPIPSHPIPCHAVSPVPSGKVCVPHAAFSSDHILALTLFLRPSRVSCAVLGGPRYILPSLNLAAKPSLGSDFFDPNAAMVLYILYSTVHSTYSTQSVHTQYSTVQPAPARCAAWALHAIHPSIFTQPAGLFPQRAGPGCYA